MADPKVEAAELAKFLSGVSGQIEAIVKHAFTEAYRLGYSQGDSAAIARVLQVARPIETASETRPTFQQAQGAETHKLIALVMQASPSGKATPTQIQRSPVNKDGIKLGAIGKALRRGTRNKIYINHGDGHYSKA